MFSQNLSLKEAANASRRLGTSLKAGVDILRALGSEQKVGSPRYRSEMAEVEKAIREGKSLAEALVMRGKYFPLMMIQLVHAAEAAGRLDQTLLYLGEYFDDLLKTRNDFLRQIAWPSIQLVLGLCIISFTILIQGMLSASGKPAFDATGLGLSGASGFFIFWAVVLLFASVVGICIFGLWKNWFNCHRTVLPILQRIPLLGAPLQTLSLARLTLSLSMLLNAGVDARKCVKQAFRSTGNFFLMSGMQRAIDSVSSGSSFSVAFEQAGVFPREFIEEVEVGEVSGTETESLDRLARQYQEKAKGALKTLAMFASGTVWALVVILLVFMILSMAMKIGGVYSEAINNPMGNPTAR